MTEAGEEARLQVTCSFCGKGRDRVKKLVAGPGVFICDQCIDLCDEVLEEESRARAGDVVAYADLAEARRPLLEKTALITGGGKGIGRAISAALANLGASIVINYRSDAEAAEETAQLLRGTAVKCDVGDPDEVAAMVKAVGQVDILVNNAGAVRDKLLLRMTQKDWDDIIRTDLSAAFHTTKAVMSGMLRSRWGRIVNMSSIVGITGNPGQANYAAAKAGLIGFTKAIAKEVGSRRITCNAVAPGYVRTELTEGSLTDEIVAELVRMTPLQREGTPEDVAAAVAFLCSPQAGFITGHVLVVDGGLAL